MKISAYGAAIFGLGLLEVYVLLRANRESFSEQLTWVMLAFGAFDNFLIALGFVINSLFSDQVFRSLSLGRYGAHAILVPWLLVVISDLAELPGYVRALSYVVSTVLSLYEFYATFVKNGGIIFKAEEKFGTLRLVNKNVKGPPVITILVNVAVLLVSYRICTSTGNYAVLFGSAASFVVNAVPISSYGTLPGSIGEAALFISILIAFNQMETTSILA